MNFTLIDSLVLAAFFGGILAVSLWKSRGEKDSAGYFLGDRSLTWGIIGISIVAANISTEQMVGMAGAGAGGVGLAVSNWQLTGSVGIVLIALTLLPHFLRAGIYTIPEYLEYRYNAAARTLMAVSMFIIYTLVLLPAVLYSGALVLESVFGLNLTQGVIVLAVAAALFAVWGGLKAVAWADLFMGLGLLLGGTLVFVLGLRACGGWDAFAAANETKLHMILPADNADLPWTGVVSGMGIVILYYCGLNQFIVQRNLAAKTLRDGQLGMMLAGALWLLVPFIIVMPGLMAGQLYGAELATPDAAFPTLLTRILPEGARGFMLAAIGGAIVSSLASMANSGSTIFTMDVYARWLDRAAPQARLVWIGRGLTAFGLVVGGALAPLLADPDFGGVFQFIQQFQGYIWPGVCAAFVFGMLVPTAPPCAGVAALVAGPGLYWLFQNYAKNLNFLIQVSVVFVLLLFIMGLITFWMPLKEPRALPERHDIGLKTEPVVLWSGAAVIAAVAVFYAVFW